MSLSITKFPEKFVNNDPSLLSKWSAVHHEMIFGMQRQDYPVQTFYNAGTQVLIVAITFGTMIDNPLPGDKVYVESGNTSGTFTIATFSFPNIFTFEPQVWTGGNVSAFINLFSRTNYFIRTNVFGVNQANQYFFIGQSINKPDNTGKATVDVSSFLKAAVDYVDEFEYIALNAKDLTLGGSYNITFSENWVGFTGEFSGLSNDILRFYVNAAKQIQDVLGENMGEFLPIFIDQSPPLVEEGKFLSDFESPTYFPNFPFSLSFIYSEYLVGIKTFRNQENFNINGVLQASPAPAELSNAEVQEVNRLLIDENFASTDECTEVWLQTDGEVDCVKYQQPVYVQIGYVIEVCGLPIIDLPNDDDDSPL